MGSYLEKPVTEKYSEEGKGNGTVWGSSEMQGWRKGMEDTHITLASLDGDLSSLSLFAVFDGHGGKEVAEFCKAYVPPIFSGNLRAMKGDEVPRIREAMCRTFYQMDEMLRLPEHYTKAFIDRTNAREEAGADGRRLSQKPQVIQMMEQKLKEKLEADMAEAKRLGRISREEAKQLGMRMSILKKLEDYNPEAGEGTEEKNPAGPATTCGCTAVCVVLTPTAIVCCNAGDSRAVLSRGGLAVALSDDHKPNRPCERERIEKAGGTVEAQASSGPRITYRVRPGGLSLSRAIGDFSGKARHDLGPEAQMVCATPEDMVECRSAADDEFIIIACDGIWDVKENEEACDFVRRRLLKGMGLSAIIEELLAECMCKDPKATCGIGGDNMTCVVVLLKDPASFPPVDACTTEDNRKKSCLPFLCGRRQ